MGQFQLAAPTQALSHVSETQYQRIHLLFRDSRNSSLPPIVVPQQANVLRTLTMRISKALADKSLGIWCQLMQHRLCYLPYHSHPVLAMA